MVRKAVFFSLMSLLFLVQLLFFSRVMLENRVFSSNNIEYLYPQSEQVLELNVLSSLGIKLNSIEYDEKTNLYFQSLSKYPFSYENSLTFINQANSFSHNKKYFLNLDENIDLANLIKIDFSFVESNKINYIVNDLEKIELDLYLTESNVENISGFDDNGLVGSGAEIKINVFDKDNSWIGTSSGHININNNDVYSLNVSFEDETYFYLYINTLNQEKVLSYQGNDILAEIKNVNMTFPKQNIAYYLNTLEIKDKSGWCDYSSDCFSYQTCIYQKCFDDVFLYWNFYNHNQTHVLDLSINKNHGEINENVSLDTGKSYYSVSLKNNSEIKSSINLQTNNLSYGGWIKFNNYSDLNQESIIFNLDDFGFIKINETGYVYCELDSILTDKVLLKEKEWHNVFCMYDSEELSIYVDGILNNSQGVVASINLNEFFLSGENYFIGNIDEVLIFSEKISQQKLDYLISNTFLSLTPSDYCHIDFDCNFNKRCVNRICYESPILYYSFESFSESYVYDELKNNLNSLYFGKLSRSGINGFAFTNFGNDSSLILDEEIFLENNFTFFTQFKLNGWNGSEQYLFYFYNETESILNVKINEYKNLEINLNNSKLIFDQEILDDRWYTLTSLYNGSDLIIYLDGLKRNSTSASFNEFSGNIIFSGSEASYSNMTIDEIVLLNSALSSSEVWNLHRSFIFPRLKQYHGKVIVKEKQN